MKNIREKQEEEVKKKTNRWGGITNTEDGPPTDNYNGWQKCDKMMPAKHKLDTVQAGKT